MLSSPPPVQPIDRLIWEHRNLLEQIDELLAIAAKPFDRKWSQIDIKVGFVMRFLDLHQESEERFLFPLVSELGDVVISELREEHRNLFAASDSLVAVLGTRDKPTFIDDLQALRRDLAGHFCNEESGVFANSDKLFSPAQMDIMRIKFATRKAT